MRWSQRALTSRMFQQLLLHVGWGNITCSLIAIIHEPRGSRDILCHGCLPIAPKTFLSLCLTRLTIVYVPTFAHCHQGNLKQGSVLLQEFWEVCKICNKSAIKPEAPVLFRAMDLRTFHCPAEDSFRLIDLKSNLLKAKSVILFVSDLRPQKILDQKS